MIGQENQCVQTQYCSTEHACSL